MWIAFASLITGIVISFWLPRRRVWGRLDADGRLALVMRADRYVDAGREFGRLLDDLVAARRASPPRRAVGQRSDVAGRLTPRGGASRESAATPSRTWVRNIELEIGWLHSR